MSWTYATTLQIYTDLKPLRKAGVLLSLDVRPAQADRGTAAMRRAARVTAAMRTATRGRVVRTAVWRWAAAKKVGERMNGGGD
jgi:hypothetical protein